jgi:glycosyltransferase involved in cell wall biosynthesis
VSALRKKKRVYDAHELFSEMKEVVSRPNIYRLWKTIERKFVPKYTYGYTVNNYISSILNEKYQVDYQVIRNIPILRNGINKTIPETFFYIRVLFNHGRNFETLIPAFQWISTPLFIYGTGNFFEQAKQLVEEYRLQDKVFLKGPIEPEKLKEITPKAILGITIFENKGLSNYYSLANRFFDYMHAGIPQICVDYPAYKKLIHSLKWLC